MKSKFSNQWTGSKQTRKQRKYRANAPLHKVHKMMSVNLSKELRKKHGTRNIPIKKGDSVKIMKGKFKKKTGKISVVSLKNKKVAVEGIQTKKKDGTKINVWFDASNLQIQNLNLEGKKRMKRVKKVEKKPETKSESKEVKEEKK